MAEGHSWILAQSEQPTDEEHSWVMLTREGGIVPIPDEKILYTSRPRVGLEVSTPKDLRISEPFSARSDNGIAYITNLRVIYLPARPTDDFKSFASPILKFEETHLRQSLFRPWSWHGSCRPVTGGGIPAHIPRIDVKLEFKDYGHSDFQSTFERTKERLYRARELGHAVGIDEDLPPYEPGEPTQTGAASCSEPPAAAAPATTPTQPELPQHAPDEPPPDYIEAQTLALGMQYEERERDEAERRGDGLDSDTRQP